MRLKFICRYDTHYTRSRFTILGSCSDSLQRQVAKLASGFFYRWSFLRNNNMAANLQRFASSNSRRRFAACDCWTQTSWLAGNVARQWLADRGKAHSFILCEKKHGWICSNASTTLKNPMLVWDCECDQWAWVNNLSNYAYAGVFSHIIKPRDLLECLRRLVGIHLHR